MTENTDGSIILTKEEYEMILRDLRLLRHLLEAGVDNWEGYGSWDDEEDE